MDDLGTRFEIAKWILDHPIRLDRFKSAGQIAVDLAADPDFRVSQEDAVRRLPNGYFTDDDLTVATGGKVIAKGLGASPGVATGAVVITAEDAVERSEDTDVILVRQETSPADVHGMSAAKEILRKWAAQIGTLEERSEQPQTHSQERDMPRIANKTAIITGRQEALARLPRQHFVDGILALIWGYTDLPTV